MPIGYPIADAVILQAHEWYMAEPERTLTEASRRLGIHPSTLGRRCQLLGLAVKPMGGIKPVITDELLREAHEWYMAEPQRRLCDTTRHSGISATTLKRGWRRLGLGGKPSGGRRGRQAPRGATTYETVLAAYRAGATVDELTVRYGLLTPAVLGILQSAGESCAECGILFRETDDGIALSGGRLVCQDCVDVWGLPVESWERASRQYVSDYAEMGACYALMAV
jgi:hypothetical protein